MDSITNDQIAGDEFPTSEEFSKIQEGKQTDNVPAEEDASNMGQENGDILTEEKYMNIVIIDLNQREISLKMVQYELVLELREFLSEYVYTCFVTHYYFEHMGRRLNDYEELEGLNLIEEPRIYMRREKYDEKNARQHIRRVIEILTNPPVLSASADQSYTHQKITGGTSQQQQQQYDQSSEERKTSPTQNSSQGTEYEERLRKNYEEFMAMVEKESRKDVPLPQRNNSSLLRDIFKVTMELEMNKVQQIKCLENISFSSFNPIPVQRRMLGELFYIYVKTLDRGDHNITCCVNGFYKNDNIEKQFFSPGPSQKQNPCFSYTLVECLLQLSPAFGKNLELYINSILASEPYCLTQPPLPIHYWISQEQQFNKFRYLIQSKNEQATLTPLYGLNPKGIRDWNEEYQVVKDFPKDTLLQRIQRDRALYKVYNDFEYAAVRGAMAIVDNNLMPLNPNESENQQVFVYNYVFFSYAIDLIDSFRDLTSTENNPSFTQANHDLNGLRTLQKLDIEGLHLLATCLVNFKGRRVIAQSIIPGILNNNDLASLAEYGSVDEQKTINANQQFHKMMRQVCEMLNIKQVKVLDGNGEPVEIAGSLEVKGIKGTDKRNYLVDLQGLTPRDTNFMGDEYAACLLRPELLKIYQRAKNVEYAQQKLIEWTKQEEERKKEFEEENKDLTEKELQQIRNQESLNKLRMFDKFMQEAPQFSYNTNVFKNVKFAMNEEEIKEDEDLVLDLAKFLKEDAIAKLIKDLQNVENMPADSKNLEASFHSHGVNMRYLGHLSNQLKESDSNHLKFMLEREVVFRCCKHIFNEYIRSTCDPYISSVIAHLLNILLAPFPFLDYLNQEKIEYIDQTIQNEILQARHLHFNQDFAMSQSQRSQFSQDVSVQSSSLSESRVDSEIDPKEDQSSQYSSDQQNLQQQFQQQPQKSRTKNHKKKNKKKNKVKEYNQEIQQDQPQKAEQPKLNNNTNSFRNPTNVAGSLSEMLLKQTQDIQYFTVDELFQNNSMLKGFVFVDQPHTLKLRPSDLYNQIKEIALKRYQYQLPENQTELKCLQNSVSKISLLRDLCRKVGIKIDSHKEKDYIFDNQISVLFNRLTTQIQLQIQKQQEEAFLNNQPYLQSFHLPQSLDELLTYDNLPFHTSDIIEIFPVIKNLQFDNNDMQIMQLQAKKAYKEGYFERSFELYSQCINALLQITGPMNEEVAQCISKLASIQFKFGDFLQAIELQTKCIVLQERLLGYDHPDTAYSLCNLALYHHSCGYFSKAFQYMHKALVILKVVCGENHPDISALYVNLGLMYQDFEHYQAAIDCFLESLFRNIALFGEKHFQVSTCYQAIAQAHSQLTDYRKALEYQEKAHKILSSLFPSDDHFVKSSQAQMDQFMKLSVYMEKLKNHESQQRTLGQNRGGGTLNPNIHYLQQMKQQFIQMTQESQLRQGRRNLKSNSLFQRISNPRNRGKIVKDMLSYNYMREKQQMLSELQKEHQEKEAATLNNSSQL